jgi:Uma2 family endonuclease
MLSVDAWLDEKPYKELYDGVVHEKVSPLRTHGRVMGEIYMLLRAWSRGRGDVSLEWRMYLAEGVTLVPDLAFVSKERLAPLSHAEREKPPFAPDIAVEVRSPEDREANVRRKTELYLQHGAVIVLNVDPSTREVRLTDATGERTLKSGDAVEHPAFPGLSIEVEEIFALVESE